MWQLTASRIFFEIGHHRFRPAKAVHPYHVRSPLLQFFARDDAHFSPMGIISKSFDHIGGELYLWGKILYDSLPRNDIDLPLNKIVKTRIKN